MQHTRTSVGVYRVVDLETLLRLSKFETETLSAENFEIMVQIKLNKVTKNASGS